MPKLQPINVNLQLITKEINVDETAVDYSKLTRYFKHTGSSVPVIRVFLLHDEDETIAQEISQDVISFGLTKTYQSGQRSTLNLTLANDKHKYKPKFVNGLVHIGSKFRVDIGLVVNNVAYWKRMGVFLLNNPQASRESNNKTITFSLCDKFGLFDGSISGKTGLREIVPVGVSMYQAFNTMIHFDKGNGTPYDTKPILFNSQYKDQEVYYTYKQDAGGLLSEIFIALAETISSDVYYNEYGNLCVASNVNEFINGNLPMVWQFVDGDRDLFNISYSEKTGDVVNTVVVKGNIIDGYQFTATATNNNPLSPIAVQYRGNMYEVIKDTALFADKLCLDRAQYELLNFSRGVRTLNISCPLLPIWDVNQFILFNLEEDDIINELYVIDSISYSNTGMTMALSSWNEVIF